MMSFFSKRTETQDVSREDVLLVVDLPDIPSLDVTQMTVAQVHRLIPLLEGELKRKEADYSEMSVERYRLAKYKKYDGDEDKLTL